MSSPGTPDWKAQEAPPLLKECPVKREESWPHVCMTLRKVLTKTDLVSHFVLPLSKNTNAGMCKCGGAKKARAEVYALTGHNKEGIFRRGMCRRLFPNCMVLVCNNVTNRPSIQKLTRSRDRKVLEGVLVEAGKIDPKRAMV